MRNRKKRGYLFHHGSGYCVLLNNFWWYMGLSDKPGKAGNCISIISAGLTSKGSRDMGKNIAVADKKPGNGKYSLSVAT